MATFKARRTWLIGLAAVIGAAALVGIAAPARAASTLCFADGRINTNCAAPMAIYCNNGGIDFYWLDGQGQVLWSLSKTRQEIETIRRSKVTKPSLLATFFDISVSVDLNGETHKSSSSADIYWLPSKEFQVNADSDSYEGKTYIIRWGECSPGGVTFEKWVEPED